MSYTRPPGRRFPREFLWGAATAAYQIEGAVAEDGRGPSIWDTFSRTAGKVANGDTGDVAADHYHRVPQDVALMGDLGLQAYRFSVAWPRIQATGSGPANPAGLAFYSDLVDRLLTAGIKPIVTLYHWDLPQTLQDAGGWAARDTAHRFADYAAIVAAALGDRVHLWTTFNEPWCSAHLGYGSGEHAPGTPDPARALASVHHLNLAHGLGARAVRGVLGDVAPISVTYNLQVHQAASASPADLAAKRKLDVIANEVFLGPVLEGAYPEEVFASTARFTDWSFIHDGDLADIHVPLDVLGLNYYNTSRVAARREPVVVDPRAPFVPTTAFGCEDVEWLEQPGPRTEMGWNIDSRGLTDLLLDLHRRFPDLPVMITENGAAFDDRVAPDGVVHDADRTAYLYDHLDAVGAAIDAGADVRGYMLWSLMDNFEWAWGYTRRFGIVRVDHDTQVRTVKDSGRWYRELIRSGRLPAVLPTEVLPAAPITAVATR
ncbi:GH1 family beta-glucosidase [Pengzhenrongella frigida]|uniref:Beta-glucosidase n=1 Tax=Pengzhenrongella frigida TaxID=1259133 RepID=A0A4Q5N3T5_9MICO|nr:GH1 family beta-glucosidase [Cellulomonas sp. HLT2-17]RYV51933.1 beta-glucosidase [Cellulomonas sp. HLT2-17]